MESIMRAVGLSRVFGLCGDDSSCAWVNHMTTFASLLTLTDRPLMMDGREDICITGILTLLVDVVSIPPLPISVATKTNQITLDSCCTKKRDLPHTLDDGSIYYQLCYN